MNSIGNINNSLNALMRQRTGVSALSGNTESNAAATKAAELSKQMNAYLKSLESAKQAVAKMNTLAQDAAQMKKAAAAERVQRIKQQIKTLMMMGGVGDPKANARQIALLARELASAARDYASAGGSDTQQNVATETAAVSTDSRAASSDAESNEASEESDEVAVSTSGATASVEKEDETSDEKASNNSVLTEGSRQYLDNLKTQTKEELKNKLAELNQKSSVSEADKEFAREVRELAAKLKAMAKLQEVRLKLAGDSSAKDEIAKIHEALREIEKTVTKITTPISEPAASINTFA